MTQNGELYLSYDQFLKQIEYVSKWLYKFKETTKV